jgi:two-component system, NarL family, nitrate/nitrite response regulator NarL
MRSWKARSIVSELILTMEAERKPRCDAKVARLFLVIENRMLREATSALLHKQPDFCIVDSIRYSPSAYALIDSSDCNILLIDQASAAALSPNFISDLLASSRQRKAVLFGMENDPEQFLLAVRAGTSGYLLGEASAEDIIAAIRKVIVGEAVSPPCLCHHLFQLVARTTREGAMILNQRLCLRLGLTGRQQQLIAFLARGFTNKEIAESMRISEFTVKNHVHRIMRRLNAQSRYAAVQTVCENNLGSI